MELSKTNAESAKMPNIKIMKKSNSVIFIPFAPNFVAKTRQDIHSDVCKQLLKNLWLLLLAMKLLKSLVIREQSKRKQPYQQMP